MVTRKFPIRGFFVDEQNKTMVGKELTEIKPGEKLFAPLRIGEGKANDETKKKFKFQ